jgi:hypothetical protein
MEVRLFNLSVTPVLSISDGDTVNFLDASNQQHAIRLAEIDERTKILPTIEPKISRIAFGHSVRPIAKERQHVEPRRPQSDSAGWQ